MSHEIYPYSRGDRLDDRNTYFYSAYHGPAFLEAWQASRRAALAELPAARRPQLSAANAGQADTAKRLTALLERASAVEPTLERLLQRFEVSKRIYREYDADFRAVRDSGYDDLELYGLFGAVCVDSQRRPAPLRFLNALLKVVDSLISVRARLGPEQGACLAWLIEEERAWVLALRARELARPLAPAHALGAASGKREPGGVAVSVLPGVLLLAGETARSQAYAQTLAAHQLLPAHALLLGEPAPLAAASDPQPPADILLPDLSIPLAHTLRSANIPITRLTQRDVNAQEVCDAVRVLAPRLIIFSGYGGQLVRGPLLELGIPLLHVHSGWLPDYRGSTTLYYSLLSERRCAASAIVLDAHIDTGPVVARKHYPAPPAGTDIDRRYDPAIRADLLLHVLRAYHSTGHLPEEVPQRPDEGHTFYVIHPVLKHLALLRLPPR